jgi:hypothetical protein
VLLTEPHILYIDVAELCRDSFVVSYDQSNRLLIVTENSPELTKV